MNMIIDKVLDSRHTLGKKKIWVRSVAYVIIHTSNYAKKAINKHFLKIVEKIL